MQMKQLKTMWKNYKSKRITFNKYSPDKIHSITTTKITKNDLT